MPGRKPVPTQLKILRGNPGKRPLNKDEPQPDVEIPEPPPFLSDLALQEWKDISQTLKQLGLITKIDRTMLAMYCQAYGRWAKAEAIINEKGELFKTANGNIMTSPMLWVANKAMEQMHKFLGEFGMSPAQRSKVTVKKKKDNNPWTNL